MQYSVYSPRVLTDMVARKPSRPAWVHFEVIWNELRGHHPWPICHDPNWEQTLRFAQPAPRDVWGVDLPILLPELLWARTAESLSAIIKDWRSGTPRGIARAQHELAGLLLEWVCIEWERTSHPNMLSEHERIERAEALVRNDLSAGLSVSDMATAAGYSRSRFSEVFLSARQQTPGQFLLRSRMERARALLRQTELSARTVAQLVGYHDDTAFGRAFREQYGLSPQAWRKKHKRGSVKKL